MSTLTTTTRRQGSVTTSPDTNRALAVTYGVLKALRSRIADLEAEIKQDFLAALEVGDSKAATLDDGTRLGTVSKSAGRSTPSVVDPAAFLAWVAKNYPDEITRTVRPAFEHKLIDAAKRIGDPVDPATGEFVPGIGFTSGNAYISYRSLPGSQEIIAARWHEIAGPSLLDGA